MVIARGYVARTSIVVSVLALSSLVQAQIIRQVDPYDLCAGGCTRTIPDITSGGTVTLSSNQVIDVVILGDGYLSVCSNNTKKACTTSAECGLGTCNSERADFFNDADDWYERLFGSAAADGIRPLTFFPEAFRVWAVFTPSTARASGPADIDRNSYYKVKMECSTSCDIVSDPSWWDDNDATNQAFRNNLFSAVDQVSPINGARYSSTLNSGNLITDLADLYSNLVVVMLVRRMGDGGQPGGVTINVPRTTGKARIRAATGETWQHEFFHAFSYLRDEYIGTRGSTATLNNYPDSLQSVFNISNLTYSNDRCDLPWAHIAPGARYNSNVKSLIGNLFVGGREEQGVWHSEYNCLINGRHENYRCNVDASEAYGSLRDSAHLCFWCEEITAMRILEKAGQLARAGDSADINVRGREWFSRWKSDLRSDYYAHFNFGELIAEKNACYATYSGTPCPSTFPNCQNACKSNEKPACLRGCGIRGIGNAMFVDSGASGIPDGSRDSPFTDISTAINESYLNMKCTAPHLIVIKPGSYPDATYETSSVWLADGCSSVLIGN